MVGLSALLHGHNGHVFKLDLDPHSLVYAPVLCCHTNQNQNEQQKQVADPPDDAETRVRSDSAVDEQYSGPIFHAELKPAEIEADLVLVSHAVT